MTFFDKIYFRDDCFHNMFVYQASFTTIELNKDKCTDYVLGWK